MSAQDKTQELLKGMQHPDPMRRSFAALRVVREIKPPNPLIEAALFRLLEDDDVDVRKAAAGVLVAVDRDRPAAPLINPLRRKSGSDSHPPYREGDPVSAEEIVDYELQRLRSINPVPILRAALQEGDISVRRRAALVLGRSGSPEAVTALQESLKDPSEEVRRASSYALGYCGREAIDLLVSTALKDPAPAVRRAAASALAGPKDPAAVKALISLLADKDRRVRERACWSLSSQGEPGFRALSQATSEGSLAIRIRAWRCLRRLRRAHRALAKHRITWWVWWRFLRRI